MSEQHRGHGAHDPYGTRPGDGPDAGGYGDPHGSTYDGTYGGPPGPDSAHPTYEQYGQYGQHGQHQRYGGYEQQGRQAAPGAPGPYGASRASDTRGTYDAYGAPAPPPAPAQPAGPAYGDPRQPAPGRPAHPGHRRPMPPPAGTASAASAAPAPASAPTAAGSSRTPRTTSPLIAPGPVPALLTAVLAVALACTAPLGRAPAAVAVVLLQAVTAAGWFRLNGMWPARQGIALAFLAGVAADVGLLLTGGGHAPAVLLGALGAWCLPTLVLHLRNRSAPDERLYALTAGFTAATLAVIASGHLAALQVVSAGAVTTGSAAVAVAVLVRALPLPAYVSPIVALLAGAGAGAALGVLTGPDGGSAVHGALVGLAAAGCAVAGLRVASYDFPSRFVHMTAGVALPLAFAAPAVYVLGRVVG